MSDFFTQAFDFLAKGGVLMIFIFLCSIASIVFFIERMIALSGASRTTKQLRTSLIEAVKDGQFERALMLCDNHVCPLSRLAQTAISNRHLSREAIQEAVADEGKRQFAKLNRFIPALGVIASISPLLGLLGTVTGMIQVFSNLADEYAAGAHANPGMLAGGIWEALLTTAAGLCVAIPAFLLHRILNAKLDALWLELEEDSTHIIDLIVPPKARDASAASTGTQTPSASTSPNDAHAKSSENTANDAHKDTAKS